MAGTLLGQVDWGSTRDDEGHRDYTIRWLIDAGYSDGPAVAMATAGLPAVGTTWSFGNDVDVYAYCLPSWNARAVITKEPNRYWLVEQPFSTKPLKRCQTTTIESPLNEPMRIGGSFTKYTAEARADRNGDAIKTSSHEQIRGSAVERDENRPNVSIGMNLASLPLSAFTPMVDTVNDATLWGVAARSVKLSNVSWTRQLYGTCTYYYTVDYEFDINGDTFDRELLDEGSKVLACGGDISKPADFVQYKDINGENARVILDGSGAAWDGTGSPGVIAVEFYNESNFLLLGIPASL